MRIYFERSGGFAGMRVSTTIDTESLGSAETDELQKLIDTAKFFALPALITTTSPAGVDQFQYKVTIETGDRQHTVETGDAGAPDTLLPLLQKLTRLARTKPGS
jgi:hypothetical protein